MIQSRHVSCSWLWVHWQEQRKCDFWAYVALRSGSSTRIYIPNLKWIAPANPEQAKFYSLLHLYFTHFAHSALKHKHILWSSCNSTHIKGLLKLIAVPIVVGIWGRYMDLWLIAQVKRLNIYHAYRVERWCNYRRRLEKNKDKEHGEMTQNPTCVKIMWFNLWTHLF